MKLAFSALIASLFHTCHSSWRFVRLLTEPNIVLYNQRFPGYDCLVACKSACIVISQKEQVLAICSGFGSNFSHVLSVRYLPFADLSRLVIRSETVGTFALLGNNFSGLQTSTAALDFTLSGLAKYGNVWPQFLCKQLFLAQPPLQV